MNLQNPIKHMSSKDFQEVEEMLKGKDKEAIAQSFKELLDELDKKERDLMMRILERSAKKGNMSEDKNLEHKTKSLLKGLTIADKARFVKILFKLSTNPKFQSVAEHLL